MSHMKRIFIIACIILTTASTAFAEECRVGLTLIPPGTITNKVDLDIIKCQFFFFAHNLYLIEIFITCKALKGITLSERLG